MGKAKSGSDIIPTPVWVLVVRIFQIVLSIVVIGLAGWWIHGLYANPLGFAIVCCIFTWIISVYNIISERVAACNHLYNTWATLALDLLMIIFWLSAMGSVAAYKGTFNTVVTASCWSDGSAIDSGRCQIFRRATGVASFAALDMLGGLAGVCAILMLLFVASFAYVAHFFRLAHVGKFTDPEKPSPDTTTDPTVGTGPAEGIPQQHPGLFSHQQQPTYSPGHEHPQQGFAQPTGYPQQAAPGQYDHSRLHDPYAPQNTGYAGAGDAYPQAPTGQQQQPVHGNPHGTA